MQTYDELLDIVLGKMNHLDFIKPGMIPSIDLYMDQITTFMDTHMKNSKRYEDDKILTKTMINNYAKNELLPPPEKKKYSSEHMYMLAMIYYLKSLLSISDIQVLMKPLSEKYFHSKDNYNTEEIFHMIYGACRTRVDQTKASIEDAYSFAKTHATDAPDDLKTLTFISILGFEMYLRKVSIEQILDIMHNDEKIKNEQKEKDKHKEKQPNHDKK